MKRLSLVLLCCLLLSGCGGLPRAQEMENMALLRTMGVDLEEDDTLAVTLSTGPRAKGLEGAHQPALVLSARHASLSGACLSTQGQSENYVFFGFVDQLLLGESIAKDGILPVLDYLARNQELGLGAQVWLVQDCTAGEAVRSGGDQGIDSRLTTLQLDSELGLATVTRTAGEVYTQTLEQGASYVPVLTLAPEDEENTSLLTDGYGVIKNGVLVGHLTGEAARGLELLDSQPIENVLEAQLIENRAVVRVIGAKTTVAPVFQGKNLVGLRLTCRVNARMSEFERPLNAEQLRQLHTILQEREQTRLEQALAQLQLWQADCTGLSRQVSLSAPGRWQAIEEDWPRQFAQVKPEVTVELSIHE